MDILDLRPWPERRLAGLEDPDSTLGRVLSPFSGLYRLGSGIQRSLVPRRTLPSPPYSIAVGNLRVGGTGKTPVVAELVRSLRDRGMDCAILSRGYRAAEGGDEPDWLERETGARVILDANRRRGFEEARAMGVQAVVLDDAFQSREQARTRLCILLAQDLERAPRTLPAGPARETTAALERAHGLLVRREVGDPPVTGEQLPDEWRELPLHGFRLRPLALRDSQQNELPLESLREWGPALLVSGLARPQSFEADARAAGVVAAAALRFSDHARFGPAEEGHLERAVRESGAGWILSTEKNAARLAALEPAVPVWALRSRLVWDGEGPGEWLAGLVSRA